MTLDIHLPGGQSFAARGSVRWIREDTDFEALGGVGVALSEVPGQVRRAIDVFMRAREPLFYPDADLF